MKKLSATLLGALVVPLLVVSCGSGSNGSAEVDESPEGQAFAYRSALMQSIAWKVGQARGMAEGEIPVDEEAFTKHAEDLVVLAGMIPEGFIPNSIVEGSAALPEIFTNMADFEAKAMDMQAAAQSLADAAQSQGFEAAKGMVQALGQSCGGCHRPYRQRQE